MKHKVVSGRGLDGWTVGAMGLDKGVGDRVYAISHSLAAVIALATMEIGLIDLCSKSKRFLDVQIVHTIQGRRLIEPHSTQNSPVKLQMIS